MKLFDVVMGRRLANREQAQTRIGWIEAVPAMGLDGLGSASYGPEAALTVLLPLGAASAVWAAPVMAAILALLGILYFSYRQTIVAYPSNGGAYTVARENLGRDASLLAAAALMIDYVLNVAVGISAGVGALTSILPQAQPFTLPICLGILALVTIANLRGASEAGWLFALPTYLFIALFLGLIGVGAWRLIAHAGQAAAIIAPAPAPAPDAATRDASAWLLLRAFAAGCTAMTGVEAVSNGVGAFKDPVVPQAHRTLTVICATLALLLAGVAALAGAFHIVAMDQTRPGYRSVLAQLTGAVAGHGPVYVAAMASVLAVLCLSANTSFVGFPRICKLVAADGFLPRPFASADRRLVFSVGVLFLAAAAGLLLIVFGGVTDRLIPLFAIGAFLTFTLSQAGMVAHWRRQAGAHRGRMAINALGAGATGVALAIILVAKFVEGAWIVVLAIPAILTLLKAIHRYYVRLDADLGCAGPFVLGETLPPTILVPVEGRSRMTDRALRFAMSLSPDVVAAHLLRLDGPDSAVDDPELKRRWHEEVEAPMTAAGHPPPRLVLLPAPFRRIHAPLLEFIERTDRETPDRTVAVLIPELVLRHWWERPLHARRAERLRAALLTHGDERLTVMTTPWRR